MRVFCLFGLLLFSSSSIATAQTTSVSAEGKIFVMPDLGNPNGPGQGGTRDVSVWGTVRMVILDLHPEDVGKESIAQAFVFEHYSQDPCGGQFPAIIANCTSSLPAGGAGQVQLCAAPQFGTLQRSCDDSWRTFAAAKIRFGDGPRSGASHRSTCGTQLCIDCM